MGKSAKFATFHSHPVSPEEKKNRKLRIRTQEVIENKASAPKQEPKKTQKTTTKAPQKGKKQPNFPEKQPQRALLTALLLTACTHPVTLQSDRPTAPADGTSLFHLTAPVTIQSGARYAHLESPTVLRTAIIPGRITVASGSQTLTLTTTPIDPETALHLDTPADQSAFRSWFTYLAEAQFFRQPIPKEIKDCAALIRYSYREALAVHNDEWIAAARLPELPSIPAIKKYNYPFTPLGANLFRIGPAKYAQFADAETLVRFNSHFVSKDLDQAQPGDILMYRQLSGHMPFHTMIYLGPSQIDHSPGPYVVYHTGPQGEIRRPTLSELQRHPDPQWRPFPANVNFLGIYRWNIL